MARLALLLVVVGAAGRSAQAEINLIAPGAVEQHSTLGYNPRDTFVQLGGADINAFNFNFIANFPIAIGLDYPENAGVKLSLALNYNTRLWLEQWSRCHRTNLVRIRRHNPFGLGFDLHMGRVVFVPTSRSCTDPLASDDGEGSIAYVSPTGDRHLLVFQATEGGVDIYRSFDGTYLKALHDANGWTIRFPSGEIHEFHRYVAGPTLPDLKDPLLACCVRIPGSDGRGSWDCPGSPDPFIPDDASWQGIDRDYVGWHLTRVHSARDARIPAESYVVTYYGEDSTGPNDPEDRFPYVIKRIEDQFGRVIRFSLQLDSASPDFGQMISIETPAPPDAGTGAARTATYVLTYASKQLWIRVPLTDPPNHTAKVLTSLEGPALVEDQGYRYRHQFTYTDSHQFDTTVHGIPYYGGQIRDITYPSGRLRRLSYAGYAYLTERSYPPPLGRDEVERFYGVSMIEEFVDGDPTHADPSNRQVTSFSHQLIENCVPPGGLCEDFDQQNTMVDKFGNQTVMLFDTPHETGVNPAIGRIVSEEYLGGADVKKLVEYDYAVLQASTCNRDSYSTPSVVTTTFKDDTTAAGASLATPTRLIVTNSDFDAFGRPQRVETSGNAVGNETLVTITDDASDNELLGGVCFPTLRDKNLGGVVLSEEVRVKAGAVETTLERTDYSIDPATGQRQAAVQLLNATAGIESCFPQAFPGPGSVVTEYLYTSAGDVRQEKRYIAGGSGDAGTVFTWDYTYQYGTVATGRNAGLPYFDFSRVVDPATGLILEQRVAPITPDDLAAVTSRTKYDILGRAIHRQVGDDLPTVTQYLHDAVGGGAGRLREVRQVRGSGDQETISARQYEFGRLVREDALLSDGTWGYRHTRYDNAGRVEFVSEWTAEATLSAAPGTTTDYTFLDSQGGSYEDTTGRPSRTTDALGNVRTFRYFGLNKAVTVQGVSGGDAVERVLNPETIYYEDGLRRLRVVDSPKDGSTVEGADVQYTYDIRGKLREVRLASNVAMGPTATDRYASSAGAAPQLRSFQYDALGRQSSATHPERGTSTTLSWNALGSPIDVQDAKGASWHHLTRTAYDAAGRPTVVSRVLDGVSAWSSVHDPGASNWTANGWSTTNSQACLQRNAWYHGSGSCGYATSAAQVATLESPSISNVPVGATLSFDYFREVRSESAASGDRDRFWVEYTTYNSCAGQRNPLEPCTLDPDGNCIEEPDPGDPCTPGWKAWASLYALDSSQLSFSRWMRSQAIRLPVSGQIKVRFVFESVDVNPNATLRGVGIGQVVIRDPGPLTLVEMTYDQDFAIAGNRARGQLTTVRSFNESTDAADHVRILEYVSPEGALTGERFVVDWDLNGSPAEFRASYDYDNLGQLTARTLPHPWMETARTYEYGYRHGQLVRLESVLNGVRQKLIDDQGSVTPGIKHNAAGLPDEYRFGNGSLQRITYNAAWLPQQIKGERPGEPAIFDTGVYGYDGARNIKAIGSDIYRYDTAGRLTWSRVVGGAVNGTIDIANRYDMYGNMTDQLTAPMGQQSGTGVGPAGLHFSGRTYAGNKMNQAPFAFDQNGNLLYERAHDGVGGYNYVFTPENRVGYVQDSDVATRGRFRLEAAYDGGGHRWLRRMWSEGGKALVSFRDATGKVTADFEEASASGGLKHVKDYVYAGSQLVAVNSYCGPRPDLALDTPSKANGNVRFVRTDHVTAQDGFTILIQSGGGQRRVLTRPSNMATHFEIAESEFFPYQTNWVSIQTDAACGATGHSNAVSYTYFPPQNPSPTCLTSLGASRTAGSIALQSTHSCPSGTGYIIYFQRLGDDAIGPLNTKPITNPNKILSNQPAGTGYGSYWVETVVGGNISVASGPAIDFGPPNEDPDPGSGGSVTIPPEVNAQFFHWDHLGSTRAITDEKGIVMARYKYYPFGLLADVAGGDDNRMMFTGHERDNALGVDYMLARYYGTGLARFLSVDPKTNIDRNSATPQGWNRYAYVRNNPLALIDPDGEADIYVFRPAATSTTSAWSAIQVQARQHGNTVTLYNGSSATVQNYTQALSQPGAIVVFSGHTVYDSNNLTVGSVQLSNGDVGTMQGGTSTAAPTATPEVQASTVGLFGCDTTDLATQYSPATVTAVDGGGNGGTTLRALDAAAAGYTDSLARNRDAGSATTQADAAIKRSADPRDKDGDKATVQNPEKK